MESSQYKITLDLHDMSSPVILNVNRGETGVRIIATLMESGVAYGIAAGCYAVFAGTKPDGTILWNKCTIDGDEIIYEVTAQTVSVVGSYSAQMRLYGANGKLICAPDFTLVVDANAVEDETVVTESANEITALTELIGEVRELIAEMDDLKSSIGGSSGASGSSVTIGEVTLLAANWVGDEDPYSQVVEIDGVTENSQVDLKPSVEQLTIFHDKDLAFVTENDGGIVTVYAIGEKPENDYTMQVSITEVNV